MYIYQDFGKDPTEWEKDVYIAAKGFGYINVNDIKNKTITL